METTYAVAVRRVQTDYILITASSQEEAIERADILMQEGEPSITLGEDGYEEQRIIDAEPTTITGDGERDDLAANDTQIQELEAEDGASI